MSRNTNPVFNQNSPLVDPATGKVQRPWNSFFQQFTQKAPAVENILDNPYTPNVLGKVIIKGAATITLTRGKVAIDLTGQVIIPMGIGDTLSYTGPATIQWLGGL